MIDRLYNNSANLATKAPMRFERFLASEINITSQLTGIIGARGAGKTILLLQQLYKLLQQKKNAIYISLDDIYFADHKFIYFAEEFAKNGGEWIFVDEVHKYKNWSQELKNIYDTIPYLHVIFTSSSALEIHKGSHDLSRRAIMHKLKGLSFREFLLLKEGISLPKLNLEDILSNHLEISAEINKQIKIFPYFKDYLKNGYYPFFIDTEKDYLKQLLNTTNTVLEVDIPAIHNIDFNAVIKLKKLLSIIAQIVPYIPNIEKLAKQIETTRPTLLKYLYYLDKAEILLWLGQDANGINYLNKPEKIFLNNTNLAWAVANDIPDKGNIRETFFLNQVSLKHKITYSKKADFLVNKKYLFEVGGKNKKKKQIKGIPNAYIVADDIEYGFQNTIPLWLFGLLY